jgi:hypothetical protein
MGLIIEDGTGKGYQAEVNEQNMLSVSSVVKGLNYYANRQGNFYSVTDVMTPDSTGSCFYYIKNTGDSDLIIQRLSIHVASHEVIKGYLNDLGVPIGGITHVPVNRNGGSNNVCDCSAKCGSNITGLAGGDHFDSFHVPADNHSHTYRWSAGVMIPKNRTFTLYVVNGNIEIDFTVTFFCCADV